MHFGIQVQPQNTTWDDLRDVALQVDALGYDSLWAWDHFVPISNGSIYGDQLESWQIVPAWAALTKHVRIGTLVTGITYRNPAILAKQVTALDHISGGRAILGLGAAWMEAEHAAYGIAFPPARERLTMLAEGTQIIRSMLDKPRTTFEGKSYQVFDAPNEPKPLQKKLPILIGGGGEKRTLRITARWADMWHGFGAPEVIAHKIEVLRAHCADVGRDPSEILALAGGALLVTADRTSVEARQALIVERHRVTGRPNPITGGTPDELAARVFAYHQAGAGGFILSMSSPFHRETIERFITEVKPRVEALVRASGG